MLSRFANLQNLFLMKLIYSSLIESRLRYGIILWGSASRTALLRVFRLQKRAVRIIAGVNRRTSCKELFKSFQILTLPSLFIYEMLLFYKFKFTSYQTGTNTHNYNTRHRDHHRQISHRLGVAASLPHNIGPKLLNKLPNNIKLERAPNKFKISLHSFLLEGAFYSVDEFLMEQ